MDDLTRREFVGVTAATLTGTALSTEVTEGADAIPASVRCSMSINGERHEMDCDPRVTLLDLLRDRLHLTGTKKGCDHGQCGACTVLVDGIRVNSCLSLAVAQDGSSITTIEGLAGAAGLHPLQAAFIERDGFQCGFCTSGQICSGVGMLKEWQRGMPSLLTNSLSTAPVNGTSELPQLSDAEIRERMAGNICRCGAYTNIVAALRDVGQNQSEGSRS
jgi:xanthine dehydrogenase YagT iron-sulfur-binding subunit